VEKINFLCSDLMSGDITKENAFEILQLTTKLGMQNEGVLNFVEENMKELTECDGWTSLNRDTILVLLHNNKLSIEEPQLFEAILEWGRAECVRQKKNEKKDLKEVLGDILQLIRFPLFSVQELAGVSSSGMIDQNELVSLFSYCSMTDPNDKKKMKVGYPTKEREGANLNDWKLTVSSTYDALQPQQTKESLLTEDFYSGCGTNSGSSWIQASFKRPVKPKSVKIGPMHKNPNAWSPTNGSGGQFQYSNDGYTWTTVQSYTYQSMQPTIIPIKDVRARYWRLFYSGHLGTSMFIFSNK